MNTTIKFRNKSHCWYVDYNEHDDMPELARIKLRRERYWQDGCDHPDDTYVGSAQFTEYTYVNGVREYTEVCIDVYVFPDKLMNTQSVCIRCADSASAYISPGTVLDLLITAQKERHAEGTHYSAAACVINHYMEIRATLRPLNQ